MTLTLGAVWSGVKGLAEAVQAIASVMKKLRANPDAAAGDLAAVLEEIAKTHRAVDDAIERYVSLVDDPTAFAQGATRLYALEGGRLGSDVAGGLGHCHQIRVIYEGHVERWFERVLDPTEQVLMKGTFAALGEADGTQFRKLASVADRLDEGASEAIDLYRSKDPDGARRRLGQDVDELRQLRRELSKTMKSLREMQVELMQIARP